jgi:ketosteroid isomerase-like protein
MPLPTPPIGLRTDTGYWRGVSQENVQIVRAGLDAYNRRDLDALLEHAAPDFVFDLSRAIGPQRGVYELDQFRAWVTDLWATFEVHQFEPHEFIDAGEHVVVPVTAHARGRDGVEATADTASVYTFRDGAVTRISMYQGRQEALEAVGLSE